MSNDSSSRQEIALRNYSRALEAGVQRQARGGLVVTTTDNGPTYNVSVLGVAEGGRYLIVTALENPDHSLIAVVRGKSLICRWFNQTTAFRFRAEIVRLLFEPAPVIYLQMPRTVEKRIVRQLPRANINLHAILRWSTAQAQGVASDLSVGGARVAVAEELKLSKGHDLELLLRPQVLGQLFPLQLKCKVAMVFGRSDKAHPSLEFHGLDFQDVQQIDLLVLHAYVQERLAVDADWLSQVLEQRAIEAPASK